MTFREAIQIQIKALQDLYDNAEGLRDCVEEGPQKEAFNNARRLLPGIWGQYQKLDNSMSEGLAGYDLRGDYSIKITKEDVC